MDLVSGNFANSVLGEARRTRQFWYDSKIESIVYPPNGVSKLPKIAPKTVLTRVPETWSVWKNELNFYPSIRNNHYVS